MSNELKLCVLKPAKPGRAYLLLESPSSIFPIVDVKYLVYFLMALIFLVTILSLFLTLPVLFFSERAASFPDFPVKLSLAVLSVKLPESLCQ